MLHAERLKGVHPDLARVVRLASERLAPDITLLVLEGLRSLDRQRKLIALGASKLKDPTKGRHLTGHAVDLGVMVDYDGDGDLDLRWDWPLYHKVAAVMKEAAKELGIPIEWGGDWKDPADGPHYQLPYKQYPIKKEA